MKTAQSSKGEKSKIESEASSAAIAEQVQAFLKAGNAIEVVPSSLDKVPVKPRAR